MVMDEKRKAQLLTDFQRIKLLGRDTLVELRDTASAIYRGRVSGLVRGPHPDIHNQNPQLAGDADVQAARRLVLEFQHEYQVNNVTRRESQYSVQAWAEGVFGMALPGWEGVRRVFDRCLEEVAEAKKLLNGAQDTDEGPPAEVDANKLAGELADILIILYQVAELADIDLLAAVDRKMVVNRDRRWNVAEGQGVGQHVE